MCLSQFCPHDAPTHVYPPESGLHVTRVAAACLPGPAHQPRVVQTVRRAGTRLKNDFYINWYRITLIHGQFWRHY